MEVVRFAVAVVLVLSSVSPCKAAASATPSGGGGDAHSMPCIQKLMPCQPYLRSATPPPPPSCCMPLKEIVENDLTCLCSVFNDVDMLKSLNLTKENALVLPNACGAKADVSKCKTTTAGTTTPTSPANEQTGSGSTGESATSTAKSTSSAPVTNFVGLTFGFGFASAMILSKLFF